MASIVKRVLIIAPQWIGDAVMTEPLVNACVQAGDEVTVAALPHIAPVYKAMQGVKQVLDWSFKRKRIELIKRIRIAQTLKNRFDRCIICPNSFKSALIPWMANVPERIGYLGEHRTWILTKALANPDRHHRGSMVNFYKGIPDKNNYRRFKIKSVKGIDDYKMLAEVVRRRYQRLIAQNLPLPDLILVDGGLAHLTTAQRELEVLGLNLPLVSIAKEEESIYTKNSAVPIKFKSDNAALNLIRRIRDEAHRFAISYHHLLHKKRIIGK